MWILVDYDNLDRLERQRGLEHVVWLTLSRIEAQYPIGADRIQVRLYGGWYLGETLSHLAQELTTEIFATYPAPVDISGDKSKMCRVNVELARSILVDPSTDLFHTYRPRGVSGIRCHGPPYKNCVRPKDCQTAKLHEFFNSRQCVVNGCSVKAKNVFYRAEQKLVDSMLIADLIYLVDQGCSVSVVSSDDDLWPGMRLALEYGKPIIHMHPRKGQQTPDMYKVRAPSNYIELRRK